MAFVLHRIRNYHGLTFMELGSNRYAAMINLPESCLEKWVAPCDCEVGIKIEMVLRKKLSISLPIETIIILLLL